MLFRILKTSWFLPSRPSLISGPWRHLYLVRSRPRHGFWKKRSLPDYRC